MFQFTKFEPLPDGVDKEAVVRGTTVVELGIEFQSDCWGMARDIYVAMHPLGAEAPITKEMESDGASIIWEKRDVSDAQGLALEVFSAMADAKRLAEPDPEPDRSAAPRMTR